MEGKRTAAKEIVATLERATKPLACHEFAIPDYSQTNISARLRELARAGIVVGKRREGKAFKEWSIAQPKLGLT